ncbi:MAG: T9SS type A sorting domain-containing protein [Saprospiraceae bacterium]
MKKLLYTLLFVLMAFANIQAQAVLILDDNLQCGTYTYCIDIKLNANSGTFDLGTSSILLDYNIEALTFQSYVPNAFDSTNCSTDWLPQQYDIDAETGEFSLTMKPINSNSCVTVDATQQTIGTLCFSINQQGASPEIRINTDETLFNNNSPDNGTNNITFQTDSLVTAGVLACDCVGAGTACDDNNVFTTNDQFDINCNCNGTISDNDNDGIPDGVDGCQDDVYEAEDAYFVGTGIGSNHLQFFGEGFIDYQAWQNDTLKFTIDVANTGIHDIIIRYANGNSWNRRLDVTIDNIVVQNDFQFPTTDTSWKVWDTLIIHHNFTIGTHTILLTPPSTHLWHEPNIDRLTVSHCIACATAGQSCDDGNPCTTSDMIDINCNCTGVFEDADNDGVCDNSDICPNGDDNLDADTDGTPDFCDDCDNNLIGTTCDDGNPCTINDVYDASCNCSGTTTGNDTDFDGVCDAYDVCAGGDDNLDEDEDGTPDFCDTCDDRLVGKPCDDGNPCTVLDVYNASCGCGGIPIHVEISALVSDVTCYSFDDGIIDIDVAGAFGELDYIWNTGDVISDLDSLAPGNYSVTVTDFRNCKDSADYVITEPADLIGNYNMIASADSNGSIDFTPFGGIQPYNFAWETGDTTEDLNNLIPYTYNLTLTDSNNCVEDISIDVYPSDMCVDTIIQAEDGILHLMGKDTWNERWALGDGFIYLRDSIDETATYTINIPADGFYTIGFRYTDKWATRGVEIIIDGTTEFAELDFPRTYDWANWQKLEFVQHFTAGSHQFVIAHANDNWGPWIDFISVCDGVHVPIIAEADITDNICFGATDGEITVHADGGTRNYTYLWSNGETTQTITNLLAGDYFVTITDEVGQTEIDTFAVGQPTEITPVYTITPVKCNGGTNGRSSVQVSGGTSGYAYNWNTGQTWKNSGNVAAGTYYLTVTDANGCVDTSHSIVTEPDAMDVIFNNTVSNGNNGTIDMTPLGGNAPYTYYWKDSVLTEDRTGLAVGSYRVTITDSKGCWYRDYTNIYPDGLCLDTIMEAEEGIYSNMSYNIWHRDSATGRGYLHFSNDTLGNATYDFHIPQEGWYAIGFRYSNQYGTTRNAQIDIDGTTEFLDFGFPSTIVWDNYEFIDFDKYYTAGTHTLTLRHRQNWSPRIDFITVCDLSLEGDVVQSDIECFGDNDGSASANVSGGRKEYEYLWNTGDTTATIDNLTAGSYTVSVTDTLNQVYTETITINAPSAALDVTSNINDAISGATGNIDITPTGGTSPYTFLWNNGATTEDRIDINRGIYHLTITDNNGCEKIDSFFVYDENGVLPVELLYFKANVINQAIQTEWQTNSEINNKGFWLQRSTNGVDFENLTWIDGQGNSTEIHTYQYLDKNIVPNTIYYYRLKQIDFDESYDYSNIVNAHINATLGGIVIYPNPIRDNLIIEFEQSFSGSIKIIDLLGREHFNLQLENQQKWLYNLETLPSQFYFIIIESNGERYVEKILKQ